MSGIIGKKIGMSRIIAESGAMVPVTLVLVNPLTVVAHKTLARDGYEATVVGADPRGKYKNIGNEYVEISEFEGIFANIGEQFGVEILEGKTAAKVIGTTRGRGFAGVIKRYGFAGGPGSHGSVFHREPGSSGTRKHPGKILKGKKFPGHMGAEQQTLRSVPIIKLDRENGLVVLKGSVPGANGGYLFIEALS